ncbi:hypothetical protein DL93DRAFT_2083553 [Clavulina sp. PMI_390]|nr:hypothetical protein DL93DRAFT_2083553 [Clavulina sp. PMI_390]
MLSVVYIVSISTTRFSSSQALNFNSVPAYNEVHNGDLTYYDTGYVGCGDVSNSFYLL